MGKKTEFVLKSVKGLLWAEILLLFSSLLNAQEGRIYTNTTSIQLVSYCNDPAKSDDLPLHCSVPVSASTITLAKLDQYSTENFSSQEHGAMHGPSRGCESPGA